MYHIIGVLACDANIQPFKFKVSWLVHMVSLLSFGQHYVVMQYSAVLYSTVKYSAQQFSKRAVSGHEPQSVRALINREPQSVRES